MLSAFKSQMSSPRTKKCQLFDELLHVDDFEMMNDSIELRLHQINGPATNSTLSDFEISEYTSPSKF